VALIGEPESARVQHYLESIDASQAIIAALEAKAQEFPFLSDEIGAVIGDEKKQIAFYRKQLELA
jgi:hypothetical protein